MDINVDVAIVGYGPGGAVLASLLGQRGHTVAVLEKFPAPYNLPRMSTLDGEIARVLQHAADPAAALKDSQVHWGAPATGVEDLGDRVVVTATRASDGEQIRVSALRRRHGRGTEFRPGGGRHHHGRDPAP